ncbi:2-phosphosulfolactate phosphatase [Salana multivorans]
MPQPDETAPFAQSAYPVRLDWGTAGLDRLAPADVVVVVDVLRFSTTVTDRAAAGEQVPLDDAAHAVSINGAAVAVRAAEARDRLVLLGCLRNAAAVAETVLTEQAWLGRRLSVTVLAAGELTAREVGAPLRFAVEDLLGAGAVVDALSERGIDHTSPEAAAAQESFRSLRRALGHLLTASGSGRELLARGRREEVEAAAVLDATSAVPVLRDGVFVRYS